MHQKKSTRIPEHRVRDGVAVFSELDIDLGLVLQISIRAQFFVLGLCNRQIRATKPNLKTKADSDQKNNFDPTPQNTHTASTPLHPGAHPWDWSG
jgi:hypothetical protein